MNVMMLAAGEGTRLRPYTNILPKPAIPFLTIPLAAHSLNFIRGHAINKLVVNTFHLPLKIHELFHMLPHGAKELIFSDEVGEILGNGGGLGKAQQHFHGGGDFVMMNSDEVILPVQSNFLEQAFHEHKKNRTLATLLVMEYPGIGTKFGGVWCTKEGRVLGFGKSPIQGSERAWHFIGVQILSEEIFSFIPPHGASNILYDAVAKGIAEGHRVQVLPIQCSWFETGNPADYFEASAECFKHLCSGQDSYQKTFLLDTISRFAPGRVKIQNTGASQRILSPKANISSSASLEGLIIVGNGGVIEADCKLKNVVVGHGATVPPGTEARDVLFL